MQFDSIQYLFFVPVVVGLYWLAPHKIQNLLLLAFSYIFYGFWNWKMVGLLVGSGLVDYAASLLIYTSRCDRTRKALLAAALSFNLGILGFFKYYNFFVSDLALALGAFGVPFTSPALEILLPVGISFFTFQSMSYTLDVYFRRMVPTTRLSDYLLFTAFFPQLVAGPIERASTLLTQIQAPRTYDTQTIQSGLFLILLGLIKKLAVADHLGQVVDASFGSQTGLTLALTIYFFAFQIYFDFSAYTDIARGTAQLLGFHLRQNFDSPYASLSVGEFWRRWHMSLSTWFRDYVYIPLGGGRTGKLRQARNLVLTFTLSGLWHGANWTFLVWGLFHGVMLSLERLFKPLAIAGYGSAAGQFIRWLITFNIVCVGWILFRAPSLSAAGDVFSRLFGPVVRPFPDYLILAHALVGLALALVYEAFREQLHEAVRSDAARLLVGATGIIFVLAWGQMNGGQFIYFQF